MWLSFLSFLSLSSLSIAVQGNIVYSRGNVSGLRDKLEEIETYSTAGVDYQKDAVGKLLYFGLWAISYWKSGASEKAYQAAQAIEDLLDSKEVEPTVWFTFIGIYYACLVKLAIYKVRGERGL